MDISFLIGNNKNENKIRDDIKRLRKKPFFNFFKKSKISSKEEIIQLIVDDEKFDTDLSDDEILEDIELILCKTYIRYINQIMTVSFYNNFEHYKLYRENDFFNFTKIYYKILSANRIEDFSGIDFKEEKSSIIEEFLRTRDVYFLLERCRDLNYLLDSMVLETKIQIKEIERLNSKEYSLSDEWYGLILLYKKSNLKKRNIKFLDSLIKKN